MDTVKITPPMPDQNNCPQCGTPLPFGVLAGLCPACLLKLGAAADTVTDAKQKAFVPPSVAELAAKFPQLEILELVGKGGMGAVYKARQKQLDRIVALKILPPGIGDEPAFAERFTREAKALAKLNHPNIVTLYEFGDAGGQFYFLMEFVDGVNLRQLLAGNRMAPREALAIVPQICDALQFAHDQGIVHRDIKPENILLDRRGRVKVADFGLAKIVGNDGRADLPVSQGGEAAQQHRPTSDLTDAGKMMGTPQYMSPEQIAAPGEVDHRADIYALGVVFYQMLTGELPGKKIEAPSKKVSIDVRLDEIVLRALEKNPELRYQQVSEVKTCVETIVGTPGGNEKAESENQKTEPSDDVDLIRHWFKKLGWKVIMILIIALSFMGVNNQVSDFFFGAAVIAYLAWSWLGIRYTKKDGWKLAPEKSHESKALFGSKWWTEVFRRFTASPESSGARFSRKAIGGAAALAMSVVLILDFFVRHEKYFPLNSFYGELMFYSVAGMVLFGTIDGWIAVAQIRRSAGKIHGRWLAVFDGLLFPLLVLDAVIFALVWLVIQFLVIRPSGDMFAIGAQLGLFFALWLCVATVISVVADFFIIRRVWRAVNKDRVGVPPVESAGKKSIGKIIAIGGGAVLAAAMLVIAAVHSAQYSALRAASMTSADFHWRVFVAEAALVDKLVPAAQRKGGVSPTAKFLSKGLDGGGHSRSVGDFSVATRGFAYTDSEVAEIAPATLQTLLAGIGNQPGMLADQTRNVSGVWWPSGLGTGWVYDRSYGGTNGMSGSGGVNLGFHRQPGKDEIRIEGTVHHDEMQTRLDGSPEVHAKFLYAGSAPQNGALAFLVPLFRKDNSAHYLVVVYEVSPRGNVNTHPNPSGQPLLRVTVRVLEVPATFDDAQLLRPSGLLDSGEVKILAASYVVVPSGSEGAIDLPPNEGIGAASSPGSPVLSGRTKMLYVKPTLESGTSHVRYTLAGLVRGVGDASHALARQAIRSDSLQLGELQLTESNGLPNGRRQLVVISAEMEVLKADAAGNILTPPSAAQNFCFGPVMERANASSILPTESKIPTAAFQIRRVADDSDNSAATETVTNFIGANYVESLRLLPGVLLDGKAVENAGWNASNGRTNFLLGLTEEGSRQFEALTAANLQHRLALVFQGRVLFAPRVQAAISSRTLDVPVNWDMKDVERTMNGLNQMNNPVVDLRFGPEQESILPPLNGNYTFLNLRANRLVTTSISDLESRLFFDWQRANGADVGAAVEEKFPVLVAYGMATAPAIANGLDNASPADIWYNWNLMVNEPKARTTLVKPPTNGTDTYYFRTRDDTWGVLQITGFTENPRGVKLRYKLIQNSQTTTNTPMKTNSSKLNAAAVLLAGAISLNATNTANAQHISAATGMPMSGTTETKPIDPAIGMPVSKAGELSPTTAMTVAYSTDGAVRDPKAREALVEIRDKDVREFSQGRGDLDLFSEVNSINGALHQEDATYALFKSIRAQDPALAQQCYFYVESLLVAKGEYQWCFDHMGNPQRRFGLIQQAFTMQIKSQKRMAASRQLAAQRIAETNQKFGRTNACTPLDTSAMMKQSAEASFVAQTRQLIEILVATGHTADAEIIRDQAVTVLDDARLHSAISDAAKKIKN